MGIVLITLIIGVASLAMAGVPAVTNCTVTRTDVTGVKAVIFVAPGADAEARLDVAYAWLNYPNVPVTTVEDPPGSGIWVVPMLDATIEVIVMDGSSTPEVIKNYPRASITLVNAAPSGGSGLFPCSGGNIADYDTGDAGDTQFQNPLSAGGWSLDNTSVAINGNVIPGSVNVNFNSSDSNGDGILDGVDVQAFASDYFAYPGVYNFKSDLNFDGILNGADLTKFTTFYFDRGC